MTLFVAYSWLYIDFEFHSGPHNTFTAGYILVSFNNIASLDIHIWIQSNLNVDCIY